MQLFDLLNWHYWLGAVKNPRLALQTTTAILKYPNLFIATRGVEGRIPPPVGVLLYESVLRSGSTAANIVEVGAFKGLSTIYLAKAAQTIGKRVKSFDLFSESPRQLEEFESNLERRRVRDVVDVKIGDARETMLPCLGTEGFCVAFVDLHDVYEVVREILFQLQTIVRGGEIIIVHDVHLLGARRAVDELLERTSCTIAESLPVRGTAQLVIPSTVPGNRAGDE
jgi:predicted O-methyltransferase YrrM